MNPFEENDDNTTQLSTNIELWVDVSGRKKNTYATGFKMELTELKELLKNFKKSNGCNGSIKEDDKNHTQYIIQLQGDHLDKFIDYLKELNITNITIKGVS